MTTLVAYCPNCDDYPSEVLAFPTLGEGEYYYGGIELGIIVYGNGGESSNRFGDGTVGVPHWLQELAEWEDSVMCPECLHEAEWKHIS